MLISSVIEGGSTGDWGGQGRWPTRIPNCRYRPQVMVDINKNDFRRLTCSSKRMISEETHSTGFWVAISTSNLFSFATTQCQTSAILPQCHMVATWRAVSLLNHDIHSCFFARARAQSRPAPLLRSGPSIRFKGKIQR